jgi:hypothetical protein
MMLRLIILRRTLADLEASRQQFQEKKTAYLKMRGDPLSNVADKSVNYLETVLMVAKLNARMATTEAVLNKVRDA